MKKEKLIEITDPDGIKMWFDDAKTEFHKTNRHLAEARISIVGRKTSWTEIGLPDGAFLNCENLVKIELPHNIDFIDCGAFMNCTSLEELDIPASVHKIGYGIVSGCLSLKTINVDPDNKKYYSSSNCIIKKEAYFYRSRKEEPIVSGKELIAVCRNFKIPDDVSIIGQDVFWGIETVANNGVFLLPDSVKAIRRYAFSSVSGLKRVIGNGVIAASRKCADGDMILDFPAGCRFLDC